MSHHDTTPAGVILKTETICVALSVVRGRTHSRTSARALKIAGSGEWTYGSALYPNAISLLKKDIPNVLGMIALEYGRVRYCESERKFRERIAAEGLRVDGGLATGISEANVFVP